MRKNLTHSKCSGNISYETQYFGHLTGEETGSRAGSEPGPKSHNGEVTGQGFEAPATAPRPLRQLR